MSRLLLLGGTRSGKSREAARRAAAAAAGEVVVIATGSASDPEMAARIAAHRAARPAGWRTVETTDLGGALDRISAHSAVVVEDLDTWLGARMRDAGLLPDADVAAWSDAEVGVGEGILADLAAFWTDAGRRPGLTAVVAGQPGWGVVPLGAATRRYADLHGTACQRLAAAADEVVLVVAGCALRVRGGAGLPGVPGGGPVEPDQRDDPGDAEQPGGPAVPAALRCHGDMQVPPGTLDLAVSVLPGPPAWLCDRLAACLGDLAAYPDPAPARAAAAARHSRHPSECLLLDGAAEAFWLLPRVLRPRLAACVHPAFTEGEAALRAAGVNVVRVLRDPGDGWRLHPDQVPDGADLVLVGRPGNPTGVVDAPGAVAALCRPGRTVVVDEAFAEVLPDATGLAARRDLPGLVCLRSLTKAWGLAGLRVGYLVGDAGLVARLDGARQPWPVNTLALEAVVALAGAEDERQRRAAAVAAERDRLLGALAGIPGVTTWPSAANFVLLRAQRPGLHPRLLTEGVAARRGDTFPGLDDRYVRVAVRDAAATRALTAALRRVA